MEVKKIKGVRQPECNEIPSSKEFLESIKSAYDGPLRKGHRPPIKVQPSSPSPKKYKIKIN